ncbi:MAG: hypothetical protein IIW49_01815, partial [Treponema sp.]|nr:hypothetical protein [Treponema sp.]
TGNTVSVYHDSTLTGVGGTQYTDISPDAGTSYVNNGRGGWNYNGVAFEADATGEIRFALRPYDGLVFYGDMFDEPNVKNKQVAAILVNPSDSTKWAVTKVYANGDIVYTDNGGALGNYDSASSKVFDVGTSSRGNWMLHSVNVEAQILLQQQTGIRPENEVDSSLLIQEEALEFVKITNLYL